MKFMKKIQIPKLGEKFLLKQLVKQDPHAAGNMLNAIDKSDSYDAFISTEGMPQALKILERASVPGAKGVLKRLYTRMKAHPDEMAAFRKELEAVTGVKAEGQPTDNEST
jgi:hypothetical protein